MSADWSTGVRGRAELRFENLREKALAGVESLEPTSATPDGWCLSTIARLIHNAPDLVPAVATLQERLGDVGPLYLYPAESLHISLLGCTQREPDRMLPDGPRAQRVRAAVADVLVDHPPVAVEIGRLNLIGDQFFLEVLTDSEDWSATRKRLGAAMSAIGERAISYSDAEPVHLNIARVTGEPDVGVVRDVLLDPGFTASATAVLDTVELVVTDFVVRPDRVEVVDRFRTTARA
ncbi:2'-5' RNA ligase family protein [Actinosynnema sp. NPDC051121]